MTAEKQATLLGQLAARCEVRAANSEEPERTEWNRRADEWRNKQFDILATAARHAFVADVVSLIPTSRGIGFRDASHRHA